MSKSNLKNRINIKTVLLLVVAAVVMAVFLLSGGFYREFELVGHETTLISLNDKHIQAWVADTDRKRQTGLGIVENLEEDRGMLFLFDNELVPTFWMKGVDYPIDIIWIRDKKVVEISPNCPPDGGEKRYSPGQEVDSVLEVVAGFSEKYGISEGSLVNF